MTSTTRTRLLILGLALFVIGMIVVFTIFGGDEKPEVVETETTAIIEDGLGVSGEIEAPAIPSGLEVEEEEPEQIIEGRTASLQMAELFAERYGSYSNQGDYQNLQDLLPVMTSSYRSKTEDFLESVAGSPPAESYEGYTATKVSSEELAYNEAAGTATYEIVLQQLKVTDGGESQIEYPVLQLRLKKLGDEWKVDKADWVR